MVAAPRPLLHAYDRSHEDWKGAVEYLIGHDGPDGPERRAAVIVDYHLIPIEHYLRHRLPVSKPPFADLGAGGTPCVMLTYWAINSQTPRLLRTDDVRRLFDRYRSVALVPFEDVSMDLLERVDSPGSCRVGS